MGRWIDEHHVVELAFAQRSWQASGSSAAFFSRWQSSGLERILDERALASPAHAGHDAEQSQRKLHRYVLQIVSLCAGQADPTVARLSASLRHRGSSADGKIIAGQAGQALCIDRCGSSLKTQACRQRSPAPGPISTTWSATLMMFSSWSTTMTVLAAVPEPLDDADQPGRVVRMQTGGRLVENIQQIDQAAAERRGQRDALRLATAKSLQRRSRGK